MKRLYYQANRFIREHGIASWTIWGLLVLGMNRTIVDTAPLEEPSRFGWLSWIVVFALVDAFVVVLFIPRWAKPPASASDFLLLCWLFASAPLLLSYIVAYEQSPQWLTGVALIEAVVLMVIARRRAIRSVISPEQLGHQGE